MKYLKRFNESSEEEINRILDKISDNGIDSLSKEERLTLDKSNGKYDDSSNTDKMTFDKDGNILMNGLSYSEWENKKKNPISKEEKTKKDSCESGSCKIGNNYSDIWKFRKNKEVDESKYEVLFDDSKYSIIMEKRRTKALRVYYIYFKDIKNFNPETRESSKYITLKMVYNLDSRNYQNFKIYDNFNNEIEFNKLEVYFC